MNTQTYRFSVRHQHTEAPLAYFLEYGRAVQYAGFMNHGKAITRYYVQEEQA